MRKLTVFNHISLDGYFVDANGNMQFAQNPIPDAEWNAFVSGNAGSGGALVFGRVTYDLMASFWPTPMAAKQMPDVAERMNHLPKVVFSRTMKEASWQNTKLVKDDLVDAMRKMKDEEGDGMVIFGSGMIVSQLTQAGLVDEYQFVIDPVVLGKGRTMFDGIDKNLSLKLRSSRSFANGNVLLCYEPVM